MAKERLTTCRACGETVANSAKTCPHCGAKLKKTPKVLGIILVILGALIILGVVDSMGEEAPQKIGERENVQENAQDQPAVFSVGDIVSLDDVSVSLVNVSESSGSSGIYPAEGNVFILCEFEIENNSQKDIAISSMLSFTAYHDGYAANASITALTEKGNKNQLDGTISAGKKFNGVVGYEFPNDWQELEIKFTPDFWRGKDITFVYNRGK